MIRMQGSMRNRRGFTLSEFVISIGIMSLVFAFMGFLMLITARNTYNIHQQFTSQESAAKASQRLAFQMRNCGSFKRFDGDTGSGPFHRMKLQFPSTAGTSVTHTICLHVKRDPLYPDDDTKTSQEIRYYKRELLDSEFENQTITICETTKTVTLTVPSVITPITDSDKPLRFPAINNMKIYFKNEYRLTLETGYRYYGFAFRFSRPDFMPEGIFVTECIAKNHFMNGTADDYTVFNADSPAAITAK